MVFDSKYLLEAAEKGAVELGLGVVLRAANDSFELTFFVHDTCFTKRIEDVWGILK